MVMGNLSESTIVSRIQRSLRDPSTATFATADIHIAMNDALSDFAQDVPYLVLSTVTTQEGTAFINIGALASLLNGENETSFEAIEFPVDQTPQRLRNFSVQGSALYMDIAFKPGAAEDVRVTERRAHVLSGTTTNTLTPRLERLFIPYVAGLIAGDEAIDSIGGISIGGQRTSEQFEGRGFRVTQKIKGDLSKMRKARIAIEYPRDR